MLRTYRIIITVEVDDENPEQPENEEQIVYRAYEQARDAMVANEADWYAEEGTD